MNTPPPDGKPPEPPPTVPAPPPATPPRELDGCGCAFLSAVVWVTLLGLFFGFTTLIFPSDVDFNIPAIPAWVFWGGIACITAGSVYLGVRAERGWYEVATTRRLSAPAVVCCGMLVAMPLAVFLFLRAVCG